MRISEIEVKNPPYVPSAQVECEKKSKNVSSSGRVVCGTGAPGAQVCFKHASLSAPQCRAVIVRCTTLNIGIDDPDCARALQLCTSGKWNCHFFFHRFFSFFKWQIAKLWGPERAQRPAASESTLQTGTTRENSKEILSTQALNSTAPRNETRRSRRDTSNYEESLSSLRQNVRLK